MEVSTIILLSLFIGYFIISKHSVKERLDNLDLETDAIRMLSVTVFAMNHNNDSESQILNISIRKHIETNDPHGRISIIRNELQDLRNEARSIIPNVYALHKRADRLVITIDAFIDGMAAEGIAYNAAYNSKSAMLLYIILTTKYEGES